MRHAPRGYKYKTIESGAVDLHRNVEADVLKSIAFDPDGPLDRALGGKRRVTVDLSVMQHPPRSDSREARRRNAIYRATGEWVR